MTESYFDNLWKTLFFGGREYLSLMIGAYDFNNVSLTIGRCSISIYEISFRDDHYFFKISGTANMSGLPSPGHIVLEVTVKHLVSTFHINSINQLRETIERLTEKTLQF